MKIPFSWIKEFVDFDWPVRELAEKLTFSGLEVEDIETFGYDYAGITVAEIKTVTPHPDADKLVLCAVDTGKEVCNVVCGAKNFKPGDKAAFAGVGAVLPNGIKIKKAKIRGQVSEGMLCAEDELGISEDHEGIIILPPDSIVGTGLADIFGGPEQVLNIEVTPNRADCLCIMGVAREVAALSGSGLKQPEPPLEKSVGGGRAVQVRVEDSEGCPRYTARIISGVSIGTGPLKIRRRLSQCGVRPVNNVVDITNYVMLETGQPLHAFDIRFLEGSGIVVRRARKGESIVTLDGVERNLDENILVIADSRKPVAVAGIMGGEYSGVLPDTDVVVLESAAFNPGVVRTGARVLGLATESSYRFERGVDPNLADRASRRASDLITTYCGGTVEGGLVDVFAGQSGPKRIGLNRKRLNSLLGLDLKLSVATSIFRALELDVVAEDDESCTVQVPTFRPDLDNEADLCEEVARIYGLDKIPMPSPASIIVPDSDDSAFRAAMDCGSFLACSGLNEIMNYSFVSRRLLDLFCPENTDRRVILPNPISADHTVMRCSLLPQMVETLGKNRARQVERAGLFETGRIFFKDADGKLREEDRLAIGLMGSVGRTGLAGEQGVRDEELFLRIKGVFERLCAFLKLHGASGSLRNDMFELVSPDQSAENDFVPRTVFEANEGFMIMIDGCCRGVVGILEKGLRAEWRLVDPVAVLEVRMSPLLKRLFTTPRAAPPPSYPSVRRDISLIVPEHVRHGDIVGAAEKFAGKELTEIELFDIYRSQGTGSGRKSLAYSFTYRSLSRTLTDEKVNEIHERVKNGIRELLPVEIREG